MSAHSVSVNVMRIKAASHLVTLTHFDTDLGLLKRQQALTKTLAKTREPLPKSVDLVRGRNTEVFSN
jgi:hypothetical protein